MLDGAGKQAEAGAVSGTSREKYWSELPACEKCDRARWVVKRLEEQVHRLRVEMLRMESHEHSVGGGVLVAPGEDPALSRPPRRDRGDDVSW